MQGFHICLQGKDAAQVSPATSETPAEVAPVSAAPTEVAAAAAAAEARVVVRRSWAIVLCKVALELPPIQHLHVCKEAGCQRAALWNARGSPRPPPAHFMGAIACDRTLPSASRMASSASLGSSNFTKPKPLERCVSGLMTICTALRHFKRELSTAVMAMQL